MNEWIKVEERLPDIGASVIVHYFDEDLKEWGYSFGYLRTDHAEYTLLKFSVDDAGEYGDSDYAEVSHWIDLSDPLEIVSV